MKNNGLFSSLFIEELKDSVKLDDAASLSRRHATRSKLLSQAVRADKRMLPGIARSLEKLVDRAGLEIALLSREGTFLGEVAALTGLERTSTMTALGTVWVCVLNAAELERFVTSNPAIGLRVIRDMARRLSRIPGDL